MSYKIRLAVDNGADLQQEEAELLASIEVLESRWRRLASVCEQGQLVYEELESLLRSASPRDELVATIRAAATHTAGDNNNDGDDDDGEQENTTESIASSYVLALKTHLQSREALCGELMDLAVSGRRPALLPALAEDSCDNSETLVTLEAGATDSMISQDEGGGELTSALAHQTETAVSADETLTDPLASSASASSSVLSTLNAEASSFLANIPESALRIYSSESFNLRASEDFSEYIFQAIYSV